jgi:hypothetical protein
MNSGASGCLGGTAIRVNAVLVEQAAQAIEFAVQPLVLRDDCPAAPVGRQQVLQPPLVGDQLPVLVAQRRRAIEVARVERGLLLPPYLGEPLGGVGKVSGQLRLQACLIAVGAQQAEHLFPDLGIVGVQPGQRLGADTLAVAEQAEQ